MAHGVVCLKNEVQKLIDLKANINLPIKSIGDGNKTPLYIAAELADSFLNQNPIKKYEQRPTPSHPKNNCKKLSEVTSISIENVNKDK